MSALLANESAILPFTPAADQTDKEGYGVTLSGDTATLGASATVVCPGVILEGNDTDSQSSIGILGALKGLIRVKLGGTVTKGQYGQQHTDGRWVADAGTGSRVVSVLFLEGGAANDLVLAAPLAPSPRS